MCPSTVARVFVFSFLLLSAVLTDRARLLEASRKAPLTEVRHRKHRGMPPKNSGPARGGGAAAARALDGAGQSVASQSSGAQTGKAPVQPSPPRSEKSWGGAPRTHSGIAAKGKGAASSEKPPSVDELVDELSALVAMHKRSPLQLQELHSSLQAVTAKAAAAEKVRRGDRGAPGGWGGGGDQGRAGLDGARDCRALQARARRAAAARRRHVVVSRANRSEPYLGVAGKAG